METLWIIVLITGVAGAALLNLAHAVVRRDDFFNELEREEVEEQ